MTIDSLVQLLGLGAATGARASLTMLGIAAYAWSAPERVPEALRVLASPAALGAIVAVAIFELAADRDDDLQELLGVVQGATRTAAAGFLGFASGEGSSGLGAVTSGAVAAGVALGVSVARPRLHAILRELETEAFSPRRWANRLEEGGAIGVAVAIYAAPMIAGAVVLGALVAALVARQVAVRTEARFRRPCPHCGALIRVEAAGCPGCAADVPVVRHVDLRFLGGARDRATAAVAATASAIRQVRSSIPDRASRG